jgi:hypothetical protein
MTFDMHRARAVAEKCQSRDDSIDHDYWNAHAGVVLPAALDEIERLQKDNESLMDALLGGGAKIIINSSEQTKRISELEESNKYLSDRWAGQSATILKQESKLAKQRAALKKLGEDKRARGKALVEERKLRMQLDASRFGMGIPEEIAIARAREQLRQEKLL